MTVRDSGNQGTHSPHGHGLGVARHAARRAAVHLPHCKSVVSGRCHDFGTPTAAILSRPSRVHVKKICGCLGDSNPYAIARNNGRAYQDTIAIALSNMLPPVNDTIPAYLSIPYMSSDRALLINPPLIGPARTLPMPLPKLNKPKIMGIAVGLLLTAVLIRAQSAVYPPPKKPYTMAKIASGGSDRPRPQSVSAAVAAAAVVSAAKALIGILRSDRNPNRSWPAV